MVYSINILKRREYHLCRSSQIPHRATLDALGARIPNTIILYGQRRGRRSDVS
jgi:hypothetical protein